MASKQKWLSDLQSRIDALPYGDVQIDVTRVNRRTTRVTFTEKQTLRYRDNAEALKDITDFLSVLMDNGHTGKVQFQVEFQAGQISLLAITNTEENKYG